MAAASTRPRTWRWSSGWPGAATKSCTTEAGHSSPRTPAARDLRLWWMPEDKPSWGHGSRSGEGVRPAEAGLRQPHGCSQEAAAMSDILVAFATKAGSTEEVAAAIADALRKSGNIVDLRRARDVREPASRWGCIVLGAPIYSGRWHRDAHRFLKRHRGELERVPVAIFGMGPRSPERGGVAAVAQPARPGPGQEELADSRGRGRLRGRRPAAAPPDPPAGPARLGGDREVGPGDLRHRGQPPGLNR